MSKKTIRSKYQEKYIRYDFEIRHGVDNVNVAFAF